MSGNLNYIKSLQKSLAEMRKKQKQQDRKIKRLERELRKKEKEDQKREKARIKQNNREDLKRRKESQKNLRKLMKTRGYWNKESNRRAKEQFEKENKVETLHSKNNFKEYRIKNLFSKTIEEFLGKVRDKVLSVLSINKKVLYTLTVTMEKGIVEEGKKRQKKTTRNHHLRPPAPSIILDEDDKVKSFDSLNEKFNNRLVDLEITESGWTLKSIDNLDIKVVHYNPLSGGCILHDLPRELEGKRCLVQLSSRNNRCFQDSIHLLYVNPDRDKNIPLKIESPFDWSNISFPVSEKDIERFEKNNPTILVYVYGYDKDFYIFYKNKDFYNLSAKSRVFHLLFYKDHYYPIVNLKAFHKIIFKTEKNYHVCLSCLANFSKEEDLNIHYAYCQHEFPTRIKYPKPDTFIKFKNHSATLFHPFVGYLDIESCLEPIDELKGQTHLYQKHVGSTFGFLFVDTIKQTSEYKKFTSASGLVEHIQSCLDYISSFQLAMNNEEKQKAKNDNPENCKYCYFPFTEEDPPVKDHDHFSGKYRGTIHQSCNLKRKDTYFLPIFAHNMMRYDEKLIIRDVPINTTIIAKNLENFISFQFRHLGNGKQVKAKFLDSYKFLNSSLGNLVDTMDEKDLIQTRKYFPNHDIKRKGIFPYDFVTSEEILDTTIEFPEKEKFFSFLHQEDISDKDYKFAKQSWVNFKCKTLRDYMNCYLKLDVCLLADVFEKFRKTIYSIYNLDPAYYITMPSLALECALKYTGIRLECVSDPTMYNFIESGIRGGVSMITKRYAKANNKYMKDYDPTIPSSYIIYLDANNLYGFAMCQSLPIGNFHWIPVEDFNMDEDCFVDVDLSISKHLFKKFKDFPMCPRKEKDRLLCTLYSKKNYVCHSRYLKNILSYGYKLEKVNRVLGFTSKPWLRPYIMKNTDLRSNATSEFEKSLWKLMNNSVFGKLIENVRKRIDVKMTDDRNLSKLSKKLNFQDIMVLQDDQYLVDMRKKSVTLDRPIYGGLTILDLSKIHMNNFYYSYIHPKFGERYELLMTDTDSFLAHIQSENFYDEIKPDIEKWFDTSTIDFLETVNEKVLGMFKDELKGNIITEFVGLRSKMYAYKTEEKETLKCKGITKQGMKGIKEESKEIVFEDYKKALYGKTVSTKMNVIRSRNHCPYTETMTKKVLDPYDEKRIICKDGIHTLPWGYKEE